MLRNRAFMASCVAASLFVAETEAISATFASTGTSGKAAVMKVVNSLQALLRSVEEDQRKSENVFTKRKQWCDSTVASYQEQEDAAHTELDHLRVDLSEQQASVEEAEGTLGELRAQVTMIQRTINVTQSVLDDTSNARSATTSENSHEPDDARLLSNILQSKTQTLAYVEGEIEALVPAVAELQAQAAETKRQADDRLESTAAMNRLAASVRETCKGVVQRTSAGASARDDQAQLIEAALHALDGVAESAPSARDMSFLQVGQESAASELISIFSDSEDSGDADSGATSSAQSVNDAEVNAEADITSDEVESGSDDDVAANSLNGPVDIVAAATEMDAIADSDVADVAEVAQADEAPRVADSRHVESVAQAPSEAVVRELLAKVRSETASGAVEREWCEKQIAHNQMMLQSAQNAASRAAASVEVHADVEAQLEQALTKVSSEMAQLDAVAKESEASGKTELESFKNNGKELVLATRILAQGVSVLRKSDLNCSAATHDLIAARGAFQAQTKAFAPLENDIAAEAHKIREFAAEARRSLRRARDGIVMARDSHAARRVRSVAGKETHEEEAQGALKYLNKLARVCQQSSDSAEERRRQAELHMLEDTQEALEGHRTGRERSLRGTTKKKVDMSKLSPLERAALEMGVPMDEA